MASFSSRAPVLAALALALAACGGGSSSSGVDIRSLVPATDEVGSWARSGDLRVLNDTQAIDDVVGLDGAADPFHDAGLVQVAEQQFERAANEKITIRVWQLTSATAATNAYNDPALNAGLGTNWQVEAIGDAGRSLDTSSVFKMFVRKDAYCVYTESNWSDADAQSQARAFATAVVAKIH